MEVAASDNEPILETRKRKNAPATVAEEEDAAPESTPRRRDRSQSSTSLDEDTYYGPQNRAENDAAQNAAPTSPHNDEGAARALVRAERQRARAEF